MHVLWFCLIIPIILTALLLYVPKFRIMTKWWELFIPFTIAIITIIICQWITVSNAIKDKEYWGHMSYKIIHEEPFAYDSECSETYPCGETCSGSGANRSCSTQYCTRYYHCVENKSRNCYLIDDRDHNYYISYGKYQELDKRWNHFNHSSKKIITKDSGYTTIGDKYKRPNHGNKHVVHWDQKWETSEPIVVEHTYENRLQTQSHWGHVSKEDKIFYNLYDYPFVPGLLLTSVLTNGPKYSKTDNYLRYLNGILNTDKMGYKKVRLWILIYNNQPQSSAEYQRSYWKGGNKNEFIIMIGTNPEKDITWFDIMTQSEADILTLKTRDEINLNMMQAENGYSGKLTDNDLLQFTKWLGENVKSHYEKPSFKQYEYIRVYPSLMAVMITYLIVLIITILTGIFIVKNPWHD